MNKVKTVISHTPAAFLAPECGIVYVRFRNVLCTSDPQASGVEGFADESEFNGWEV